MLDDSMSSSMMIDLAQKHALFNPTPPPLTLETYDAAVSSSERLNIYPYHWFYSRHWLAGSMYSEASLVSVANPSLHTRTGLRAAMKIM